MSARVKPFSSALLYALKEERHFALLDGVAFSNRRLARNRFQVRNSVRPMHLFGHTRDHDYYFELSRKRRAGSPINYSVIDCTPSRFPGEPLSPSLTRRYPGCSPPLLLVSPASLAGVTRSAI